MRLDDWGPSLEINWNLDDGWLILTRSKTTGPLIPYCVRLSLGTSCLIEFNRASLTSRDILPSGVS